MKLRSTTQRGYVPPPKVERKPSNFESNCGSFHNIDCSSNLSAMQYDPTCQRCTKIKHVIALRRKGLAGAGFQEAQTANALADKLVAAYKLTRGEVMDREYAQEVTVYKQERERVRRASRSDKKFGDDNITL